ncbi:MAG TPA: TonB family protein [Thermoanaerobaculia bacterium]|jgi:protein TonB|nr:TonB family protein [Thermoanaerobaculia bacterium]
MDLRDQLIESGTHQKRRGWKATLASLGVHSAIIGLIVFMSTQATQKIAAENKPVHAFLLSKAAPPPPPPPPPAASHAASTPKIVKPVEIPQQTFVQPREIPQEVPKVDIPTPTTTAPIDPTPSQPSNDPPGAQEGGVAGGVAGGVVGGQEGGTVGGVVGGQIGGVLGGEKDGVAGGTVGGTDPSNGPLRVGGDVKAPVAITRAKPDYTDAARKGRVTGVVVVEAIVNKQGDVEQVKVLKGLPMGLSEQAVEAVKKWHFHPGTLNGQPVEVIFDLTVTFTLE